jgi:hypothetical protein
VDAARAPTNVRVVPDLDDGLLLALDHVEALVMSLAVWEMQDGVELPVPFAGRKTLNALQAVGDVVRPTQRRGGEHLVPGRLSRRGWAGRHLPLHFVPIADAPLSTLEHAVQVVTVQRAYPNLNRAVERYATVVGEAPLALVSSLSRVVSLLTLPWDDDVGRLWRSVTAYPEKCDTELSRSEQQAYDRIVHRIDDLWSYRPRVGRPTS